MQMKQTSYQCRRIGDIVLKNETRRTTLCQFIEIFSETGITHGFAPTFPYSGNSKSIAGTTLGRNV